MVVGWVNYAGIVMCVTCAEDKWGAHIIAEAKPVWKNTYGAMVPCAHCQRLVNQAHEDVRRWAC